jgi:hypothetical protein
MFTGPKIIEDNLVLYVDCYNNKSYNGSNILNDISIQNNNLTIYNSPEFSNYYLSFDGSTQYASCVHPTSNSINTTYEIVVRPHTTTQCGLITFNNATIWSGLSILADKFIGYLSPSNYKYCNVIPIQTNKWQHVVMTIPSADAKDINIYINNILDTTSTSHTGVTYTPNTMNICTTIGGTYKFDGDFAFIRCYSKILNQLEISQNFNSIRKRFGL